MNPRAIDADLRAWPTRRRPLHDIFSRISDRVRRLGSGSPARSTQHGNRQPASFKIPSDSKGQGTIFLSHVSERSILHRTPAKDLMPFVVAGRSRFATCSGVAWLGDSHLAVVNLYGGHLRIYRIHASAESGAVPTRLELVHEMSEGLAFPEDVAVSPNRKLLAVTSSVADNAGIALHRIDPTSLAPSPVGESISRGKAFHGLAFSPDSRHLAFTEIGRPGFVEVASVTETTRRRRCMLVNPHSPLKPKAVSFSSDGRFAVISLSLNVMPTLSPHDAQGMLSLHAFDQGEGIINSQPLAELRDPGAQLGSVEICKFVPGREGGPYRILAANQAGDSITAFQFEASTRRLSFDGLCASGLSFPHGLDVSPDGRFVAVASYGDDTLTICGAEGEDVESIQ